MSDQITLPAGAPRLPAPLEAAAGLRNAALDATLYGVAGLTSIERALLAPGTGTPGAVVLAHPGGGPATRGEAPGIRVFPDAAAFMAADGAHATQIAVPGGGGSELGAAALARHLADATGRPAAAVVAGYGRQEALAEAMGGAVLFAPAARLRTALGTLARRAVSEAASQRMAGRPVSLDERALTAPALAALIALLGDPARRTDLAIAHGQGALTLSAAFARLVRAGRARRAAEAQVVTLGAPTAFPPEVRWIHQVRGALDPLGAANAERDVAHHVLPLTGHHLNPAIPGRLELARILGAIMGSTA